MDTGHDARLYSSGMMASVPVIRGTRVSLWTLMEYLKDGRGLDTFLADHPQVTAAQANRAILAGLEALVDRRQEVHESARGKPGETGRPAAPPGGETGEI